MRGTGTEERGEPRIRGGPAPWHVGAIAGGARDAELFDPSHSDYLEEAVALIKLLSGQTPTFFFRPLSDSLELLPGVEGFSCVCRHVVLLTHRIDLRDQGFDELS